MRQPSLHQVLGVPCPSDAREPVEGLEVYDFFAGAGGFSEGARQAGCNVVWACDNDPLALEAHAVNHPRTEHCLAALPMPRSEWPFPTDGRAFHAHFSPPCQKFSATNTRFRTEGDLAQASDLITWSVETALASGATSWSLEEVVSPHVIALLEVVRKRHPTRVAYAAFDLTELGVPQTRTRLLAGPPALISRLMRQRNRGSIQSVRDAIAKPRGTHIRNAKSWVGSKQYVPGHSIRYHKADGATTAGR